MFSFSLFRQHSTLANSKLWNPAPPAPHHVAIVLFPCRLSPHVRYSYLPQSVPQTILFSAEPTPQSGAEAPPGRHGNFSRHDSSRSSIPQSSINRSPSPTRYADALASRVSKECSHPTVLRANLQLIRTKQQQKRPTAFTPSTKAQRFS